MFLVLNFCFLSLQGSHSSGSSHSDKIKKNVAASVGMHSGIKTFGSFAPESGSCQAIFDIYDMCMSKSAKYGASSCNSYTDMVASCNGFKRDPTHSRVIQSQKEWAERTLRTANAAGFATLDEYIADHFEKDPVYCRSRFKRYNECIKENAGDKAACDYLRNNCKEFKRNAAE